jgi:hypothetical protein
LLPPASDGPTSRAMPPKPITRPRTPNQFGRFPPGLIASIAAIQSGTDPISSAATPEATFCSAQESMPLPPNKSNNPIAVADSHCLRVGAGSPDARRHRYKMEPAIRKRVPAIRKGGMVSTA